ncbi:MAG: pseudouridine-5'-phosphate glycosidase [Actinobacteria bacterium]|jgi:pseudouridine-5'-phosphate glycosidase|nr:pseudouridine-5'-phosphate glycosidase [Actinomycetota bacterium]MCO5300607.1 pseudouridine-5'-phosphate glycosidase [Candidatus Nanopelagicales bacterium]MCB9429888.1 pseudouridine-5'-phosphate glycosidase [Actinomycetota bacterium]HPE11314.1 pseudouridine-5'-phosphate glycosidase [Actinomycetota bacterium]HPQ84729.1 pseudouridine-5'-phosphate glycosidase [Actinomycetota bacterium]
MTSNPSLRVSDAVQQAITDHTPVVALESTIFTHGLPRPRNVEVALAGEEIVRAAGGVPATIGVVHGQPVVGLTEDEIRELAYDDDVTKASIRDLSYAAVTGKNAGTTIAATALLAHAAGIDVFSTGGLGGVHHGAAESFDESADMYALAQIPVVLISSGAKAILDIRATLERFESLSVPVVGYRTDRYPGFYVADSDYPLTARVDDPADVATMMSAQKNLGIDSAVLVANPVPVDEQLDPQELDEVLQRAWAAADEQGISGQASTPFLLDFIRVATDGRSLDANVALYNNNIRLAVQIASELADGRS